MNSESQRTPTAFERRLKRGAVVLGGVLWLTTEYLLYPWSLMPLLGPLCSLIGVLIGYWIGYRLTLRLGLGRSED